MNKQNIAVVFTGHLRTAFRQLQNYYRNVYLCNKDKYNFFHYIHTYPTIGVEEKTFNFHLKLNYQIDFNEYIKAVSNYLNAKCVIFEETHQEDIALFNTLSEEEKKRPGNIMANTFQFFKKTRSYIDFCSVNKEFNEMDAYLFTRTDNHYYDKIDIPQIDFNNDESPIVFVYKDQRKLGNSEDDRFFIMPKNKEKFILNLKFNVLEHRKMIKEHIMPEESLWYSIDKYKYQKKYITKDIIKIARFKNNNEEKIEYDYFIKNYLK